MAGCRQGQAEFLQSSIFDLADPLCRYLILGCQRLQRRFGLLQPTTFKNIAASRVEIVQRMRHGGNAIVLIALRSHVLDRHLMLINQNLLVGRPAAFLLTVVNWRIDGDVMAVQARLPISL